MWLSMMKTKILNGNTNNCAIKFNTHTDTRHITPETMIIIVIILCTKHIVTDT